MDLYSLGQVLDAFTDIVDEPTKWLKDAAAWCREQRPSAADVIPHLSRDWDEQVRLFQQSGWQPEEHEGFVGREFIIDGAFGDFVHACGDKGGVFVIEGPAGVGKTALLTKWAERTGQQAGYYFRYRDNRTLAEEMPRKVAEQLRKQFELETQAVAESDAELPGLIERVCQDIARLPDPPRQLLLFIDGLDEATDPARAVGFLPKKLPRSMYVVASTRPPAQGKDHLALLRTAGAKIYPLRSESTDNLKDVQRFFREELGEQIGDEDARKLADQTGGIFQLARLLAEAIAAETLTVAAALGMSQGWLSMDPDQRLVAYYRESWERICGSDDEVKLATFAGLMAAAQDWVSESLLSQFLRWHEREALGQATVYWQPERVRSVCKSLTWFLDRKVGELTKDPSYQIRHQSVRDYLLSPDGPVSYAGLAELSGGLGSYFLKQADTRRGWRDVDTYGRFFAVRHLSQASELTGDWDLLMKAAELLCDVDYLQATLGEVSPDAARAEREGGDAA